ncbi:MAG: hypothetical protein CL610_27285 [Anaerolineaceae bacterium]|nr:hypothetical protein [Anaerolineaceae bacterium]
MLSRVADHLYWMSRYLERAEHTMRLLSVNLTMTLDQKSTRPEHRWGQLLSSLSITPPADQDLDDYGVIKLVTFEAENTNSIMSCISTARENARHVRELISSEMWERLNSLYFQMRAADVDAVCRDEAFTFLRAIYDGLLLFQGVTDSTMNHGEGWDFIQAGRYIERANATAHLLDVHNAILVQPDPDEAVERYLDWVGLLKSCTAFEAYVKIYSADVEPRHLLEFLLLNSQFPHAVCFAIRQLEEALTAIAETTEKRKGIRVNRLAGRLQAMLGYTSIDEISEGSLRGYLADVKLQCAQIHNAIHDTYIVYPFETALVS